jgi:hypothetical protein
MKSPEINAGKAKASPLTLRNRKVEIVLPLEQVAFDPDLAALSATQKTIEFQE